MKKTKIIAEIGINHNGDVDLAKELIRRSADAKVHAVKFQKRTIDLVYTKEMLDSPRESPWGTTQREQKEGIEFGQKEYDEINSYCEEKGILWSASSWDVESQKFLRQYDLPFNKAASAMLTHKKLLETIASEGKHTFISTGMSLYKDIDVAVEIFERLGCPYTLLHCVSTYPCKDEDCNINMLTTLQKMYPDVAVGYSGHEAGVIPSLLSVTFGAKVIERHITLDKDMYGSDQSASIELEEFKFLVLESRKVVNTLGTGQKIFLNHEIPVAKKLRYFEVA